MILIESTSNGGKGRNGERREGGGLFLDRIAKAEPNWVTQPKSQPRSHICPDVPKMRMKSTGVGRTSNGATILPSFLAAAGLSELMAVQENLLFTAVPSVDELHLFPSAVSRT